MGLAFVQSSASWSYNGFHEFRTRLAKTIGINLEDMVGFGGNKEWKEVKDPLKYLLNHSDCEGSISPKRCGLIAPRLLEVISTWKDEGEGTFDIEGYDKRQALMLAKSMKDCAEENQKLEFC